MYPKVMLAVSLRCSRLCLKRMALQRKGTIGLPGKVTYTRQAQQKSRVSAASLEDALLPIYARHSASRRTWSSSGMHGINTNSSVPSSAKPCILAFIASGDDKTKRAICSAIGPRGA